MIKNTKDYEMFKFRDDNRAKIDKYHVERIKNSIQSRNLLSMRPIIVNKNMEVVDGQHRLLAAKELGIDIYYTIEKDLDISDVIIMNTSKSWGPLDYLNFYVKQGMDEYIKLDQFIKKNNLQFKVAFTLIYGRAIKKFEEFRTGKFVMPEHNYNESLDLCWETIDYIKKIQGGNLWLKSARFWKSIINLFNHPDFDKVRWKRNLHKLINRIGIRATTREYIDMIYEIYNHGTKEKINYEKDIE